MSLPVFDRSVLEGVNPRGRVDVAVSKGLEVLAQRNGLAGHFEAVRPVLDFGLLYFLGPEKEFTRAVRRLSTPSQKRKNPQPRRIAGARRPSRAGRSRRVEVLEPEIVSL